MTSWFVTQDEVDRMAELYAMPLGARAVGAIMARSGATVEHHLRKRGVLRTPSEAATLKKGPKAPRWNGGKKHHPDGYVELWMPDHPRAMRGGYILRSHVVWERETGHVVESGEIVHHMGAKDDDRFEMLRLFSTNSAHSAYHARLRREARNDPE